MRRRDLIFGLVTVAAMRTARAQQSGKVHHIAIIHPSHPIAELTETSAIPAVDEIFKELRCLGYIEGRNLLIERSSGEGRAAHYPDMIHEVVRSNPDLIIALGTTRVLDFKAAATTIPIVGVFGNPVGGGIVSSLARPGGNITGVSVDVGLEPWSKRIQLLHQVVPQANRLGVLQSRASRERYVALGPELNRSPEITPVGPPLDRPIDEAEYRRVFVAMVEDGADALVVSDEPENVTNRGLIVELANTTRLAAIYPFDRLSKPWGSCPMG